MNQQKLIATIAIVIVGGLVIAGFFAAGSPNNARKEEADRIRLEHLDSLHFQLQDHAVRTGELPKSLSDLAFGESEPRFDSRKDPVTGEFFEYEKTGDLSYEVCVNFQTESSSSGRMRAPVFDGVDYSHGAGRECFRREISRNGRIPDVKRIPEVKVPPPRRG